jgi:hypothetical protein
MSFDVSEFLGSDSWGLTLYLVNGWDTYIDNTEGKTVGTYLTYAPNDDFFISLATIYGSEQWGDMRESDDIAMYNVCITYALPQVDKLSLGYDWNHGYAEDFIGHDGGGGSAGVIGGIAGDGIFDSFGSAHWWATAGYAMYDYTDNQNGALRYEYFSDSDGAKGFGYSLWTLTYTHNITIADNLMLRPEVRYNKYNIPGSETAENPNSEENTHGDKGNTFSNETIVGLGVEYVF